jgi:hypothetical protein
VQIRVTGPMDEAVRAMYLIGTVLDIVDCPAVEDRSHAVSCIVATVEVGPTSPGRQEPPRPPVAHPEPDAVPDQSC